MAYLYTIISREFRLNGFIQAMSEAGLTIKDEDILQGNFSEVDTFHAITACLQSKQPLPTAFIAGNDLSAIGAIKAFKRFGYRVPEDISVTGFDNIAVLEYFTPGLTTVDNPIELQGKTAVAHLLDLISGKALGETFELAGEMIIRHSTRYIN